MAYDGRCAAIGHAFNTVGESSLSAFETIYVAAAILLTVYALNSWILSALFLRHRKESPPPPPSGRFPKVTVQLPIFNEALVVKRLVEAAARLAWPHDRLQIQILDDSTDDTTAIAQACVDAYRAQGLQVELVHRTERHGFKAGALKEGLKSASGEFIAIFDADFVPEPDWLRKTVPYFLDRPSLGMIQTRWTHLNRDYSLLTRAQAIALDGHFMVEQTARNRSGFLMNFNGTAGVWRKQCITDAGGWQADTISEDMDLSYRAQLRGWQCLFLPHVSAAAEIPPQLAAFKRQQFRWAKGSIQCLKKLAWPVAQARLPLVVRGQALVHMSTYLVHPLLLVLLLASLPVMLLAGRLHGSLGLLGLVSLGPPLMYAISQRELYPHGWLKRYAAMPGLMLLGSGVALNNTRAVIEALLGVSNVFQRTPKFHIQARSDRWIGSSYALPLDGTVLGELALAVYAMATVAIALWQGNVYAVPFLLLYVASFSYVGLLGLWDARRDLGLWLCHTFKPRSASRQRGSSPQGMAVPGRQS
jgi:cellulose synthase/poly-beta-1,6-N-acetylglucosamine synthase-like glycosyltransferase